MAWSVLGIGSCVELGDERLVRGHLSGAPCLEDRARRRNDEAFLKALPADSIPDPTTAGDFCRRFSSGQVRPLWDALNRARRNVRKRPPPEFFDEAFSDRAGTLTVTTGECQDGLEISDKGAWGDPPPVVSLANTRAVLSIVNRSGNRPREAGAADAADRAIKLCREAGFKIIRLRGDTALSQTEHLDRWPDAGDVRFQFGCDAKKTRLELAGNPPGRRGLAPPGTRCRPGPAPSPTTSNAKSSAAASSSTWNGSANRSPSSSTHRPPADDRIGGWSSARTSRTRRATTCCSRRSVTSSTSARIARRQRRRSGSGSV